MTESDFVALVADLRSAQKEYFRTKGEAALRKAKSIEAKVDAALRDLHQRQMAIWDGLPRDPTPPRPAA